MNMQFSEKTRLGAPILRGLIWAFAIMAAGALILSLLLAFTGQRESSLPTAAYVIHTIASLFGGLTAGQKSGSKGWYTGGLTGILYAVLLYLIGFLGYDQGLHLQSLIVVGCTFGVGAFGGMIGVNLKK